MARVKPTILITGATGSIGTKLRLHFTAQGWRLRLLCLNPKQDPDVTTADLTIYEETWARQFENVDAVLHLAGNPYPDASWASAQSNIDLALNVYRAAQQYGSRRIVFASSNWVMAGYRFGQERLTTQLPPWPINAYGSAKLFCEIAGRRWAEQHDRAFIALRLGYCQHAAGNIPGPHMQNGLWGQQMWLSDRDLCQGVERAVLAENVSCAVLNLMSNNAGMRWDLEETRRVIGYVPQDGHTPVSTSAIDETERLARLERQVVERLDQLCAKW